MMDALHNFIQTRGAQLIARYAATGLTALAAHWGATLDVTSLNGAGTILGTLGAAGLLAIVDHYSHAKQQE